MTLIPLRSFRKRMLLLGWKQISSYQICSPGPVGPYSSVTLGVSGKMAVAKAVYDALCLDLENLPLLLAKGWELEPQGNEPQDHLVRHIITRRLETHDATNAP